MKRLFNFHVTIVITLSFLIGLQLAPAQDLPPEALVTEQMSQWEVFPICTATGNQNYPSVSGNIVVWTDYRWGNADIYGYDLTTGQEFPICTATRNQGDPSVSGNIVVWADSRSGYDNADIYGYDLDAGQEFPICTATGNQVDPSVSGNIVVWTDYRNSGEDIYGYDLTIEQEFPICTEAGDQSYPSVSGNIVVWEDYRSGNADIYGARPATPAEMLTLLFENVELLNLDKGIDNSLDAKIDAASHAINDLNEHNDAAAINSLQAFINAVEAQRGNKLSDEEADRLVNHANQIIALLDGGASAAPSMIRTAPAEFLLSQNYPNPFNPDTWIPYRLPYDADVIIRIHSVTGRLIRTLNLGYKPAGLYVSKSRAAHWDGIDEAGQTVPSGVYFYSIQAGEYTTTKKMIIAR